MLVAGPTVYICDACVTLSRVLLQHPPPPLEGDRDCSFCGKSSKAVEHVIAPAHGRLGICNECVDLCHNILLEKPKQ
jgi:ATP-dependent protease Clp ATPase subunit